MKLFLLKAFTLITILTLIVLLTIAASHNTGIGDVSIADQWTLITDDYSKLITLPTTLKVTNPQTPITLETSIPASDNTYMYFKSVYAPFQLFVNDILFYEYGIDESSSIFLDPPTMVDLKKLPHISTDTYKVRFEFLSPSQRERFSLFPVVLGNAKDIYSYLIQTMGFTLLLGGLLVALEVFLILAGLLMIRIPHAAPPFFWLALFISNICAWIVCDCNLISIFIPDLPLLYIFSYMALFLLVYPLLRFAIATLNLKHKMPLEILSYVILGFTCCAILLQLFSIADFSSLLYYTQALNIFTIFFLAAITFIDYIYYKNEVGKSYIIPFISFFLFGGLELINYHTHFCQVPNLFFIQISVVFFILYTTVILKLQVEYTFKMQVQNVQLSSDLTMLASQIDNQKERYALMAEHTSLLRRQRHDLRHQLSVIRRYNDLGEKEKLNTYINELSQNVPTNTDMIFCQNDVVNSVILYYYSMAQEQHIPTFDVNITIPEDIGQIHESDLCIVIGNLLENAIHACQDIDAPSITIHGKQVQDFIVISTINTCSLVQKNSSGTFRSTKNHSGIGLMSIESVADKYNGTSKFKEENGIFTSFVTLSVK